jgi:hypothetical protein
MTGGATTAGRETTLLAADQAGFKIHVPWSFRTNWGTVDVVVATVGVGVAGANIEVVVTGAAIVVTRGTTLVCRACQAGLRIHVPASFLMNWAGATAVVVVVVALGVISKVCAWQTAMLRTTPSANFISLIY